MKKHPNSPHISIKRLRELAQVYSYAKAPHRKDHQCLDSSVMEFINFVESQRSSLTSKHVKK